VERWRPEAGDVLFLTGLDVAAEEDVRRFHAALLRSLGLLPVFVVALPAGTAARVVKLDALRAAGLAVTALAVVEDGAGDERAAPPDA
jgi:hypothetical protein